MIGFEATLASLPALLALLALASGLVTAVIFYRQAAPSLGRLPRLAAGGCRLLALAAVLFLLLDPALRDPAPAAVRPLVALLVDCSLSTGVRETYPDAEERAAAVRALGLVPAAVAGDAELSRREILAAVLERSGLLDGIEARARLQAFTCGENLEAVALEARPAPALGRDLAAIYPRGRRTRLGAALREVLARLRGQPLAAVVLISDGRQTDGPETAAAAAEAAAAGVPVFAVALGSSHEPCNVALTGLAGPAAALVGDRLRLEADLGYSGAGGRALRLELRAGETLLQAREVTLPAAASGSLRQTFVVPAAAAGRLDLAVRASPLPGETTAADNERRLAIEIAGGSTKVLLVASWPGWEYRALKEFLRREGHLDAGIWLQSADPARFPAEGNHPLAELPAGEKLAAYDAVILADADCRRLPAGWLGELGRLVREGGAGLVFAAGPAHSALALQEEELARLLPVELGHDALRLLRERPAPVAAPAAPVLLRPEHFALQLGDDPAASLARWERLPGLCWYLPVDRARPGAAVLALAGGPPAGRYGPAPLIATWTAGAGRVLYLGSDETWRWAAAGAHRRFWSQVLYALRRGALAEPGPRLATDRSSYLLGERVTVTVDGAAGLPETPVVALRPPGGAAATPLPLLPAGEGRRAAAFVPGEPGAWRLWLAAAGAPSGEPPAGAARVVEVRLPEAEFRQTALDRARLEELARLTGAACLPPDRAGEIPGRLALKPPAAPPGSCRLLLETLPGAAAAYCVLLVLLALEWLIRRRAGLP